MTPILSSFGAAVAGVIAFRLVGLPLPWLLGPIVACLCTALVGVPMKGTKPHNNGMRTILGVAVGATLAPAVVATLPSFGPALVLVPCMVLAIGLVGIPYFLKVWRFDPPTAYYATMPGGLQDMLIFGEEAGGNVRTLSLVLATRVLVIVVALPFFLKGFWEADLSNPPGLPMATVPVAELILMVACALDRIDLSKGHFVFGWIYVRCCQLRKLSYQSMPPSRSRSGSGRPDGRSSLRRPMHHSRVRASSTLSLMRDGGRANFLTELLAPSAISKTAKGAEVDRSVVSCPGLAGTGYLNGHYQRPSATTSHAKMVRSLSELPPDWPEQRKILGFLHL